MDRTYLRFASVCAFGLAVTTLVVWWLSRQVAQPATFEDRLALAANSYNLARLWTSLLHMLLGFAAMLGAYVAIKPRSSGFATFGLAMFFAWMLVEMVAVSIGLFAVNAGWRAGYAAADVQTQAAFKMLLAGWPAVFDGLYFVLAVSFVIGSLIFGAMAARGKGIERVAGGFLVAGAVLGIFFLWSGYGGPQWPETVAGFVYPVVQPLGRAILGLWLWRAAGRDSRSQGATL